MNCVKGRNSLRPACQEGAFKPIGRSRSRLDLFLLKFAFLRFSQYFPGKNSFILGRSIFERNRYKSRSFQIIIDLDLGDLYCNLEIEIKSKSTAL